MKNIFLFLIILISIQAFGQFYPMERDVASKKEIGKYNYLITYKYSFRMDTLSKNSKKIFTDICKLEISNSISHYYSSYADKCDSIMYKARISNSRGGVNTTNWLQKNERPTYEDYFMNYSTIGLLTCRYAIENTEYEYIEQIPIFEWTFLSDTCNVIGYECKSAATKFRGRGYKVFFTDAIPIRSGPWKFNGLPGLILKVEELSGTFKWEAIGLSQSTGNIYIHDPLVGKTIKDIPAMKIKRISKEQLQRLQRKLWEDPIGLKVMHGAKMATYTLDAKTMEKKPFTQADWTKFKEPYIPPLELE
ncbi:MAG: GLPGLI family protein [Bacteroidales bacterium]